eukprot:1854929-Amphidinium_carterae.1
MDTGASHALYPWLPSSPSLLPSSHVGQQSALLEDTIRDDPKFPTQTPNPKRTPHVPRSLQICGAELEYIQY